MEVLREPFTMRSVDVRALLGITASTLSEIYKKLEVEFADGENAPRHGAARNLFGPDVRKILESRGFAYESPAKVVSFLMCKGGVGKTTSTYYCSQRISAYGARVLAIDTDAQGNLTEAYSLDQYNYDVDAETPVLLDVISGNCTVSDAIIKITPTMHLIPSTPMNANLEGEIRQKSKNPSLPIKRIVDEVKDQYDYILIDCAPALNLVNTAVACASDVIILPVAPDRFSQVGLDQTLNEIAQIEKDFSVRLEKKIIFTKFDAREFTSLKYLAEIAEDYGEISYQTAIRTCAEVKNVITRNQDLFMMRKSSAREDYDSFTKEILGLDKFSKARMKKSA